MTLDPVDQLISAMYMANPPEYLAARFLTVGTDARRAPPTFPGGLRKRGGMHFNK